MVIQSAIFIIPFSSCTVIGYLWGYRVGRQAMDRKWNAFMARNDGTARMMGPPPGSPEYRLYVQRIRQEINKPMTDFIEKNCPECFGTGKRPGFDHPDYSADDDTDIDNVPLHIELERNCCHCGGSGKRKHFEIYDGPTARVAAERAGGIGG